MFINDEVAVVFSDASALYVDENFDGRVDDDERAQGPLAVGSEHPQGSESQDEDASGESVITDGDATNQQGQLKAGSGCASSETNLSWAVLFPFVLLGRRWHLSAD